MCILLCCPRSTGLTRQLEASYTEPALTRVDAGAANLAPSQKFVQGLGSTWKCQYAQIYYER